MTTELDQSFVENAIRRIFRLLVALTVAGCAAEWIANGWQWGLGFLVGAAAAFINFRLLKRLVYALGQAAGNSPGHPKMRFAVILGLRYLLLGLAGYAILSYSELSLAAALTGLFVPVAAVIIEIVFELVYARN